MQNYPDIRRTRGLPISPCYYEHSFEFNPSSDVISVILYGHLRSYSYSLPLTLEYLKSRYTNLHVFVHTWDVLDSLEDSPQIFIESLRALISKYGNLIAMKIDHQNLNQQSVNPLSYMYYSMWSANMLKREHENNSMIRYDRCIKIRPDVLIQPSKNSILPMKGDYYFFGDEENYSDICAISSSFVMDKICNFLINVHFEQSKQELLRSNLEYLRDELKLMDAPLEYGKDWSIVRSSYLREVQDTYLF